MQMGSNGQAGPSLPTTSPDQSRFSTAIASSVRRTVLVTGVWSAWNSAGYSPPTPTPSIMRPPVARSSSANCLATITG